MPNDFAFGMELRTASDDRKTKTVKGDRRADFLYTY